MFTTFREYCLLPEKQMQSHSRFIHTFKKTLQFMQKQRHGPMIWVKPSWTSFDIYTRFYLSLSPSQTRVMEFIFLQPPYLQRYADAVAGKDAHLYNWFGFVDGTIPCICRPVLNENYSSQTKVHGLKFQSVILPNGWIINPEGLWEGRRRDFILCFINRIY